MKKRTKGHKRKRIWKEENFLVEEEKWKDNFWNVNPIDLHLNLDTDNDKVVDAKDCRPFDSHRQDAPTRPTIEKPSIVSVTEIPTSGFSITRHVYVQKPVPIERNYNQPVIPKAPPPVPIIAKSQQSVPRSIGSMNEVTMDAPQIARMQVAMVATMPSAREKPTSPEIQKLREESQQLHKLPYVQATKTGKIMTKTGTNLKLVSKFGEMFWADEKGNILYRAS
jgi:hypothetical protein